MRSINTSLVACFIAVAIVVGRPAASRAKGNQEEPAVSDSDRIQPYAKNPRYWQYKGRPVLLLGGSKDDNLFQVPGLREHLDLLAKVGGNYVRNTMSDRKIHGFEIHAFEKLANGKYDLALWNDEYWNRFETLLMLARQRDVIVQIEVWDRFDYTDYGRFEGWADCPYNPAKNVNYTSKESGLAASYGKRHPGADEQPFFHTIPTMDDHAVVRKYQEAFVDKMLSHSLRYGNVLYCMNNETSTSPAWGQHWMRYIRNRAAEAGVDVYVTDMFDVGWDLDKEPKFLTSFDKPDLYTFLDISQNNSNKNTVAKQWKNILFVRDRTRAHPRPINNVKVYGADEYPPKSKYHQRVWKRWGTRSAVQKFVMNALAGCASSRFHRNQSNGLGLTEPAQHCIQAVRKLESLVKMWEVNPDGRLLSGHDPHSVFLAAKPGAKYALYFVDGGSAVLDLSGERHGYKLRWISVDTGQWGKEGSITGGGKVTVSTPGKGGWIAAIVKQ